MWAKRGVAPAQRGRRPVGLPAAALVLLVALAGCGDDAPAAPGRVGVEVVDPTLCAELDECGCSQTPGCAPLTTACWCPPAACGSTAPCPCSGGRFLGCNPRGAGCTGQCGLFAAPGPRDERGCVACLEPTDCAAAAARLPALCPSSPPVDTTWLCGGAYGRCATVCVAQLETCAGATCALCQDCSCGNDLFDSCLSECLASAASRP